MVMMNTFKVKEEAHMIRYRSWSLVCFDWFEKCHMEGI